MAVTFTRQLGAESGIQLNPLQDNSEMAGFSADDQVFGIMMQCERGRIDKPFLVDSNNVYQKLGNKPLMRDYASNEAWVQVVEALNNGAMGAVVQRIVPQHNVLSGGGPDTTKNASIIPAYVVASVPGTPINVKAFYNKNVDIASTAALRDSGSYVVLSGDTILLTGQTDKRQNGPWVITSAAGSWTYARPASYHTGTSYPDDISCSVIGAGSINVGKIYVTTGPLTVGATDTTWVRQMETDYKFHTGAPSSDYLFSVIHNECFNDGIKLSFRAEEKENGSGVAVPNNKITLRLSDITGTLIHEFHGSLSKTDVDDYGNSAYLPDVVASLTDAVIVAVNPTATTIAVNSDGYGYAEDGSEQWAVSATLKCFSPGSRLDVLVDDFVDAKNSLKATTYNYQYIASGGSKDSNLIGQCAQLAYDTNRQFRLDVPGNLTPDEAIALVTSYQLGANQTSHLIHAFWAPLKSADPTGTNPTGYFGTSALNIAYACARNAQTNAKGFAPKNYPIAGAAWPLRRMGFIQTYTPTNQERSQLARAKINPVLYEVYSGGGRYVFVDSLTCANVDNSLKKLISVAEMSSSIDDAVTRYGKEVLQLPMKIGVMRMNDFLKTLFEGAEASGWIVPSNDITMKGKSWMSDVRPNEARPYERMDVSYWVRYDGTVRQIFVTQTLTK